MRDGMNHVEVQEENSIGATLYMEGGVLWLSAYEALKDTPYLPIGGGCTSVGTGFLLGGGWSFLSRSYGLGSDNVLSMRVVLANGTVVTADSATNSDLFWASRGGGGGNFGVVASFKLQTHKPRQEIMLIGQLCYEPFDPVIPTLMDWFLSELRAPMPNWMDIEPSWLLISDENSSTTDPKMFCMTVVCNGDPDSECAPIVDPIVAAYPPALNQLEAQTFSHWQLSHATITDGQGGYLYLTSGILPPGAMNAALVQQLMDALALAPSPKNLVLFHTGGGAIDDLQSTDTAFVHRGLELIIQIKAIFDDLAQEDANVAWVKSTRSIVEPYLSGSYVNYIDPRLSAWAPAYYGENYPRLLKIKHDVDPTNFFQFNQSIGRH
jgi:hypothetical protein